MQKTARKNTKYSRNETIFKIGYLAKSIAFAKWSKIKNAKNMRKTIRSKIKNAKNMRKTILQEHWSCPVEKNARKNTKYSRNKTILKIGHLSKAIAFAKCKKNSSFSKILCFLFLRFLHFWRENDVTNCVPKFGFANMGYLMLPFERTCHKDFKT